MSPSRSSCRRSGSGFPFPTGAVRLCACEWRTEDEFALVIYTGGIVVGKPFLKHQATDLALRPSTNTPSLGEKMGLSDFPPELLTKIFLGLSYKSLLRVLTVCARWKAIVATDPGLSVQLFKTLSKTLDWSRFPLLAFCSPSPEKGCTPASELVRLHPALEIASYTMGAVKTVYFYCEKNSKQPRLSELAIANEFTSIPVVTMVRLVIPERIVCANGFKIKVKNPKGVRVIDVFDAMAEEASRKVHHPHYGRMSQRELLGDHIYYEGMSNICRTGLGLSTDLYLGVLNDPPFKF
ncbi:hypothetical protein B0H16DRAFT_1860684 [Mycena metata]|uniref:F-box domain-containing protein n=1 Tax=Mycena metata TaxID=1033252 RepID=A0AAD7II61_9AGAR|nr:hypothetical protein B0H16DRAFT_1860684 [Mycena metata]